MASYWQLAGRRLVVARSLARRRAETGLSRRDGDAMQMQLVDRLIGSKGGKDSGQTMMVSTHTLIRSQHEAD